MSELLKLLLGAAFSVLATLLLALLKPLWRSKRHRNYILFSVFLLCIILTLYFSGFFAGWIASILLALLAIYIFVAYHAATRPIFLETSVLSNLAALVREGRYTEIDKRFPQRPFYIRSTPGRIKWDLLWARKLMVQEQPRLRDAYEMYSELLSFPLFEKEENKIRLNQVLALFLLGDTNKAKSIFERTKQKIDQDEYYEILYL
ncbi:MAG: hypothetical protein KAT65_26215, partial [Methanophagales archaeon]|nr:hypothetical protein [Methanophagales archaeon]